MDLVNSETFGTYLASATNFKQRYLSSAGGIGAVLVEYLFKEEIVSSAINFKFTSEGLYEPFVIYSSGEYINTGSIYHEIDLIRFIRSNINKFTENVLVFCLPCQVKAIRHILRRNGKESFIVGLVCSSQQKIEATKFLLKNIKIKESEVKYLKYRGEGWPSGITIVTKNDEKLFVSNNNSLWTKIFHSKIFILDRCYKCDTTISLISDLSIADPWLPDIIKNEKIGKSLLKVNTKLGNKVIKELLLKKYINNKEIPFSIMQSSQAFTLKRKFAYRKKNGLVKIFKKVITSSFYKRIFLSNNFLFNIHIFFQRAFDKFLVTIQKNEGFNN